MLEQELEALAAAGGTVLVGAMVTSAWQTVSKGVSGLFARTDAGRRADVQAELGDHLAMVERAADRDGARTKLAGVWQLKLAGLLQDHPEVAADLTALITEVHGELPPQQQKWVQTNIARDQSNLFAVQNGGLIVYQTPPAPTPTPGREAGEGS
jgi:hypothetical protein